MKNLEILSKNELLTINGGGGFWYDVAYALGYAAHQVSQMYETGPITPSQYR